MQVLLVLVFSAVSMLCIFISIGMTFYLGWGKMKKIDLLVYGYEIPSDSIFFQIQRMPQYGGAFACRWCAKRSSLLHIRDHFDKKFQRPFITAYYLLTIGITSMILLIILDKLFLHVT